MIVFTLQYKGDCILYIYIFILNWIKLYCDVLSVCTNSDQVTHRCMQLCCCRVLNVSRTKCTLNPTHTAVERINTVRSKAGMTALIVVAHWCFLVTICLWWCVTLNRTVWCHPSWLLVLILSEHVHYGLTLSIPPRPRSLSPPPPLPPLFLCNCVTLAPSPYVICYK